MLLLDYARNVVGMPVKGIMMGRNVGWTTDEAKGRKMAEAGATVKVADCRNGRVLGYEVSFEIGTEAREGDA